MKIKILVDSGSDITHQDCEKYNITVVPLTIVIDGVSHTDFYDFDSEEYCEQLNTFRQIPTTSQPSPSTFISYYEKFDKEYDHIIVVTMSSGGSGTYSSACLAKQLYEDDGGTAKIHIVDSKSTSCGISMIAHHAADLINQDYDFEYITEELERFKYRVTAYYLIDNIDFLIKGGRISATAGAVAAKLNIKPIITISNGMGAVHSKVMGHKKGLAKMTSLYERLSATGTKLYISHSNCRKKAETLIRSIIEKCGQIEYQIYQMHGTMCTYAGPDTIAMFFLMD